MEFDVNVVVVPILLVFLAVVVLDKFWLKQHKLSQQASKQAALAKTHLDSCQKALNAALKQHSLSADAEQFMPNESTPADLLALHDNYTAAKRQLAETTSVQTAKKEFFLIGWAYEWLPVLLFIVALQSLVVRQFNIPSSSMVPSLYTGDFILVNPAAYGIRLPLLNTKIVNTGSPKNGDVVVFRYPLDEKRYYIKRMIGIPGDVVRYEHGKLSINGKAIATEQAQYRMDTTLLGYLYPKEIMGQLLTPEKQRQIGQLEEDFAQYQTETMGEHQYKVRYLTGATTNEMAQFLQEHAADFGQSGQVWQITVPEGHYFVMGDNRDRSEDSRFWGFVSDRHLVGKANYIWMHKQPGFNLPSFERTGKID